MKIKFFEWADYEDRVFEKMHESFDLPGYELDLTSAKFNADLCKGFDAVSIFVDSRITNEDLDKLKEFGLKMILLRCAGFNMLDTEYAKSLGIKLLRVASYSPESIAEHVFALLLSLVRKLMVDRRKHAEQKDGREITQMGFTLKGKTIGFYGFGHIGQMTAKIAKYGFDMNILYFDPFTTSDNLDYRKVENLEELFSKSNIISIHTLLNDETRRSINSKYFSLAKDLILINTARGPIVDTKDALEALQNGHLAGLGLDVVEEDDSYCNLPYLDNVVLTQHTAFFTDEAVESILRQTFENIKNPAQQNIVV